MPLMHVMVVYTMSMTNLMTFAKARPALMIFINTSLILKMGHKHYTMRLLHRVKRSMSDSDLVVLGLALPISLVIVCWFSLTFLTLGSETVPATCSSAVLEDLLLLCLVSEIDRFTFCSLWLASLLVIWFAYWYSEALPMRIIPIKTFRAVRLNNSG
jgi:hypothetical protein